MKTVCVYNELIVVPLFVVSDGVGVEVLIGSDVVAEMIVVDVGANVVDISIVYVQKTLITDKLYVTLALQCVLVKINLMHCSLESN